MIGIGFDSGGTHTTFALEAGSGPIWTNASEYPDSISNARSEESIRSAIRWITSVLLEQADGDICAWIGAAGFYAGNASKFRQLFEPCLAELRDQGKHCDIFIANDAVSTLKAPPLLGKGVAAIVGTGSVVLGAHPACNTGVVKRGGHEWLVSDEGAGVWMTLECVRLLLGEIQNVGAQGYHSPLLDRLCEYFGVHSSAIADVPPSYRALARAELLAHALSEGRPDAKRRIAGFVYPHLFDLVALRPGRPHDHIATQVLTSSVEVIVGNIGAVSEELAAYTADAPNAREKVPLTVAGNIAANPIYRDLLLTAVGECKYVASSTVVGDSSELFAKLAWFYLTSTAKEQRALAKDFDPLHPVLKLM